MTALTVAILTGPVGATAATAPVNAEKRDNAEDAFSRLAELSPEKIAAFIDQRLSASLTLTDPQRTRVVAVNLDHAYQLHAIATSRDKTRVKVRAMARENHDHEAALKEVLTPDQFKTFLAMKEEIREALKNLPAEK